MSRYRVEIVVEIDVVDGLHQAYYASDEATALAARVGGVVNSYRRVPSPEIPTHSDPRERTADD